MVLPITLKYNICPCHTHSFTALLIPSFSSLIFASPRHFVNRVSCVWPFVPLGVTLPYAGELNKRLRFRIRILCLLPSAILSHFFFSFFFFISSWLSHLFCLLSTFFHWWLFFFNSFFFDVFKNIFFWLSFVLNDKVVN